MKIGFLGDPLDRQNAGVHVYTRELLRALSNILPDSDKLVLIRPERGGEFPGIQEIEMPILGIPGHQSLRMFWHIPQRLKMEKVDVVVEPAHFGPFNLPASIKRVTVIHDLTPILFPEYHVFHGRLLQQVFLKGILRRADLIITNSAYTRSDVERVYPFTKGKVVDILLGRDPFYQPAPDPDILKDYGIAQPFFLYVGTVEPRKNLPTLLNAYAQFRENSDLDFQLIIAGKMGWKTEGFEKALEASQYKESVLTLGYVPKKILRALYSACEAFIYPSIYEGFGFPVLEAMSCGAVVLASDNSSLPEVGGAAARYFNENDTNKLYELLCKVTSPEFDRGKARMESLARAQQFDWEHTARKTLEALHTLNNI